MDAFAYPFRFSGGRVVKVDDQTDAYAAQIIAAALKTGKGELALNPVYGTDAVEFTQVDLSGLLHTLSSYHPNIRIDQVEETIEDDGTVRLRIEFTKV